MTEDIRSVAARLHRQVLLVSLAFPAGVLLFGAVSYFLVSTQGPVFHLEIPALAWQVVAAVAAVAALGAGRVGEMVESQAGSTPSQIAMGYLTGNLMKAGIREGGGILGGLMILGGQSLLLGAGLVGLTTLLSLLDLPEKDGLEARLRRASLSSGEPPHS